MPILKLGINRTPSRLGLLGGARGIRALLGPGVAVPARELVEDDGWSGAYGDGDPRLSGVPDMITIGKVANQYPRHAPSSRHASTLSPRHSGGGDEDESSLRTSVVASGFHRDLPVPLRPRIPVSRGQYGRDRYGRMASFDFEGWDDDGWDPQDWSGAYPDGNPIVGFIDDGWTGRDWAAGGEEGVYFDGPEPVAGALRFSGGAVQEKIAAGARKVGATVKAKARSIRDEASPWVTQELAPAVRLQIGKGNKVTVTNTGTVDRPSWKVDPALGSLGMFAPGVGALGVATALAKGGAAVAKGARALRGTKAGEAVEGKVRKVGRSVFKEQTARLDERRASPFASRLGPGETITIGSLGGSASGDLDLDGDVLVDTDGIAYRLRG